MSTRSVIARRNADQSISAVYCHSDGYLDGVGKMLAEHWTDPVKVDQLIALGSLSVLGEEVGEQHDFSWRLGHWYDSSRFATRQEMWDAIDADPRSKWTRAYTRDRNDPVADTRPGKYADEMELLKRADDNFGAEFVYIFSPRTCLWTARELFRGAMCTVEFKLVDMPVKGAESVAQTVTS